MSWEYLSSSIFIELKYNLKKRCKLKEATISKKAEMKRRFYRNQKLITPWNTELSCPTSLAKSSYFTLGASSFSTFIYSIGIKLFIGHPVVLFGILILSEQFDGFVQLPTWWILKDRQVCLHKHVKYWVLYPIMA